MIFNFIAKTILIVFFAYLIYKKEKTNLFSLIYLSIIPLFIFYQGEIKILFLGLFLGYAIFICLRRPSLKKTLSLFVLLALIFTFYSPQIGIFKIDEATHIINQQRGEHLNPTISFLPRIFHNKLQLIYPILEKAQEIFSVKSLFIQGKYDLYSPIYHLGYLFPWDLIIICYLFSKNSNQKNFKTINPYWLIIPLIYLFIGLTSTSNQFVSIITISLVYWLAIYNSFIFKFLNKKLSFSLTLLNIIFLCLMLSLSAPFIQSL